MASGIMRANACKVALELGYSKKAINRCYVSGMRAGDLVLKIIDLEESNPEYRYDDDNEISSKDELSRKVKALNLKDNVSLKEETIQLWKKQQCHSCWKFKSNRLAIPCTHLVICENCISERCIICNSIVTDWIKVHT